MVNTLAFYFIETDRLILRSWKDEYHSIYAELNERSEDMSYLPYTLISHESYTHSDYLREEIALEAWRVLGTRSKFCSRFYWPCWT